MQRLITSVFVLAFVTSNSAEFSSRGFKSAERVGLRLGFPLNSERSGNRSIKDVPDFLLDVYACWSSQSSSTNCSSYRQVLPNSSLDVVRAVKGTGEYTYVALLCLLIRKSRCIKLIVHRF